jgi:tetratricopeptide (TPR) repeat protein
LRFKTLILAALLIISGCTQLIPRYYTASDYEKALILYGDGQLTPAKEKLLNIKKESLDYKAAQELLTKIERLSSILAERYTAIGEEYERANIFDMAAKNYRIALQFDPSKQVIQKRLKTAEQQPAPSEEIKPKKGKDAAKPEILAEGYYKKGAAFLEAKKYNEAIDEFNIALKIVPSHTNAMSFLATAKKEREEAIDAHLKKGIDYFQKEELELAIKEWDAALDIDPWNRTAIDYRARAEVILEKMKEMKKEK